VKRKPSFYVKAEVQRCPECGSVKLMRDYGSAEIVCTECGYVLDSNLTDPGPEWRTFSMEEWNRRSRIGAPATFTIHDKGLSTMIDSYNSDIRGKKFSASRKAQIYRLRKWHKKIKVSSSKERNLVSALPEIVRIVDNLSLPKSIYETASVIYRKAAKKNLIKGRVIREVSAASVYIACRQCGFARTLKDISKASNINVKDVSRCYRFLLEELHYYIPPTEAKSYLSKISNSLGMPGKTEEIANKILTTAKNLKITSGRGPVGLAAAASYIASTITGDRFTQREISEIAEVTEVTVRNRHKELVHHLLFTMDL